MDALGQPLPAATLAACREADAVLLGAVGGPAWDDPTAAARPEDALLGLRSSLELFANLRPVRAHESLAEASPLRPEVRRGADILIVRELTGGLYFGRPQGREESNGVTSAVDTLRYARPEIERIVELAFTLAAGRRGHLTSVDKANVLATSRLWREVVDEAAPRHPEVTVEHALVDSTAYLLLTDPRRFDVIVTENLFGDILSDEAAAISGSLGLLASASIGTRATEHGTFGMYEPVHGSAPQIAGTGAANPLATVASTAMLLRHSLGEEAAADALDAAVDEAIASGPANHRRRRTCDAPMRSPPSCSSASASPRPERPHERPDRPLRHDPSRRHAARGPRAVTGGQAEDRQTARRGRIRLHRGRLARLQPEGRGVLRGRPRNDVPACAAGRVRLDAPSCQSGRGGSEHPGAGGGGDAGHHDLRQELAPPRDRGARRHAGGEPGDDRRLGRASASGRAGGRLRRRALLRRVQGRSGLCPCHPAIGRRRRRDDGGAV